MDEEFSIAAVSLADTGWCLDCTAGLNSYGHLVMPDHVADFTATRGWSTWEYRGDADGYSNVHVCRPWKEVPVG